MSDKNTLLIVTAREDFAADFLILRLKERGLAYYRLNSDELADSDVTFRISNGREPERRIGCRGATIDLSQVSSVWYRRAIRPDAPSAVDPEYRAFAKAELRHLYEGLVADEAVQWVNPPQATELAERKVYQLRIASRYGLRAPETIISSDPRALAMFAETQAGVVCKPISQGLIRTSHGSYAVHTHQVDPMDIHSAAADAAALPTLVQQCIPKGTDVRVTVIGNSTFAAEIVTPPGAPVDWRASPNGLRYSVCEVPVETERACRSLMKALGLHYGAFDFVRTDAGEWFFLEVNPAGEWAWLEVELGWSMRDAFIGVLYGCT